ncbi:hypothetical protein SDC9_94351 [bioreactor metagenome]|uniref:Uncharacterized protein n=1 Tax=bioreactor metagenome TaxID=1076179 RepID=A0A645A373_9ZZZZ
MRCDIGPDFDFGQLDHHRAVLFAATAETLGESVNLFQRAFLIKQGFGAFIMKPGNPDPA